MQQLLDKQNYSIKTILLLMLIAYVFSFAIRMIWIEQMQDIDTFYWNNEIMINTNDGYFFGSSAQKELDGTLQHNPRIPDWKQAATTSLTVIAAKYTPFSLETVMLYMPAVIASLVVIPIILIAMLFNFTLIGFFAALLGSIAWSYYNRTMIGYYDTDMFSAMMPMFILYFLMATIQSEKRSFMLMSAVSIAVYPYFYDQGRSLIYAMGLFYMGYMVVFHRKERFTYESIIIIALSLMGFPIWIKLIAIAILYMIFFQVNFALAHLIYISAAAVLLFLYTGNVFTLIYMKVTAYAIRGVDTTGSLRFYEVAQTVREAGKIPFETMANRISGSTVGVLLAFIGYILLVIKHRPFILALPLIGIGIFSLFGGLRFTVYAVPIAAISVIYLFYIATQKIENQLFRTVSIALLTALMIYPNITHIINYKVPTVFNSLEVEVLNTLSKKGSDKDYVISWWDYGYPIWFYTNKNTLIDGGKHNHDNFLVSEILTTDSPVEAARLSRIAVETYVKNDYAVVADKLFNNDSKTPVDVSEYLDSLKYNSVKIPEATRDIYLYLPLRMLDIFPTVALFSKRDLNSGQAYAQRFFYTTQSYQEMGNIINFGANVILDKQSNELKIGGKSIPVQTLYTVQYDKEQHVHTAKHLLNFSAHYSIIYMPSYHRFIICDNSYVDSLFIQMFVFEKYDVGKFEPTIMTPLAKVYKLKI